MDKKSSNSVLDIGLFKRLLAFAMPYRTTFIWVLVSAVLLSGFSTLNPYLLKITIDDYITLKDYDGMLNFVVLMALTLILEVFFQFVFIYYANWLGQQVIFDLSNLHFGRRRSTKPDILQTTWIHFSILIYTCTLFASCRVGPTKRRYAWPYLH